VAVLYVDLLKRLAATPARASPPDAFMSRAQAVVSRLQVPPIPRAFSVPVANLVAYEKRKYKEDSMTSA
jgi:hypothetical protein